MKRSKNILESSDIVSRIPKSLGNNPDWHLFLYLGLIIFWLTAKKTQSRPLQNLNIVSYKIAKPNRCFNMKPSHNKEKSDRFLSLSFWSQQTKGSLLRRFKLNLVVKYQILLKPT